MHNIISRNQNTNHKHVNSDLIINNIDITYYINKIDNKILQKYNKYIGANPIKQVNLSHLCITNLNNQKKQI